MTSRDVPRSFRFDTEAVFNVSDPRRREHPLRLDMRRLRDEWPVSYTHLDVYKRQLEKQLASATYDCVVIGAGLRLPPKGLLMFEKVVNAVHKAAPGCAIAFNTRPEDTAEAANRWV